MPIQSIEGMRFFARHGFFAEEALTGNYFEVSVQLDWKELFDKEKQRFATDQAVHFVVERVMLEPTALLETLVQRILQALLIRFYDENKARDYREPLQSIEVRVHKCNPPIEQVAMSTYVGMKVTLENNFEPKFWICGVKGLRAFVKNAAQPAASQWLMADIEAQSLANRDLLKENARAPELGALLDYQKIGQAFEMVAAKPPTSVDLWCQALELQILHIVNNVEALDITVSTTNSIFNGLVSKVAIQHQQTFSSICPRCKKAMRCYKNDACWCKAFQLSERSKQLLSQHYDKKCICPDCMKQYAIPV